MLGQLLDHRYQITESLAKGGFGQTYLARDTRRPGHPICVVKQLIATIANSKPETLSVIHRLFNSEAEVLERLGRHDQIPQLLAHFDENQEFYLVQEFIPGHALTEELLPGQAWPEAKVIDYLSGILEVLAFVHHQGVIHRDIKPANIIRREPDNKLVLIDFGAVKELKTSIANKQTIEIGTPGYIPIEQFRGYPQFNSDLYSAGVIAIQAATGLGVDDLVSLLDPNSPYRGDREWRSYAQLNPELIRLLEKMTCPGYQKRYQSANEVLTDLNQIINNRNHPVPDTLIGSAIPANPSQPAVLPPQPLDRSVTPSEPIVAVPNTVIGSGATGGAPPAPQFIQPPVQPSVQPPAQLPAVPPKKGLPGLIKLLLWIGGGTTALIVLIFGLLVLRYLPGYTSRNNSTPTAPAKTVASPYFENLKACEENSERICTRDNALFDDAAVSKIQVTANIKNLEKGDKINVVIKFQGADGATEKPYPEPYEVQGLERERIFAVINRSDGGWNLGTYNFEFTVQGKSGPPGQKRFAILKNGKLQR